MTVKGLSEKVKSKWEVWLAQVIVNTVSGYIVILTIDTIA